MSLLFGEMMTVRRERINNMCRDIQLQRLMGMHFRSAPPHVSLDHSDQHTMTPGPSLSQPQGSDLGP